MKMLQLSLSSGVEIHIGTSAAENTQLVRGKEPRFLWLHLHNRPSAHCVIQAVDPSRRDVVEAARALKERSKLPCVRRTKVEVCALRHVHACEKEGEVILSKQPDYVLV